MNKLNWYLEQRKNDTLSYFKKLITDTRYLLKRRNNGS